MSDQKSLLTSAYALSSDVPLGTSMVGGSGIAGEMKQTHEPIPFFEPNVSAVREEMDLSQVINDGGGDGSSCCWTLLCCMSGVGLCYICCKAKLIDQGQYGFCNVNGRVRLMVPGWHLLASPTASFMTLVDAGRDEISVGPVTIVRVPQGSVGFAFNDGKPEVLLPGRHVRKTASFRFSATYSLSEDLLTFGPIKLLTVRSGGVRVCYDKGKVIILTPGRYAINSPTFNVAGLILTQQQNLRFSRHNVMLDGGINLLVEGLLTFKVDDVEKLIHELGDTEVVRAVEDVTKAELSRVFSGVHLEQLVSGAGPVPGVGGKVEDKDAVLGAPPQQPGELEDIRHHICRDVVEGVLPITAPWGVRIINFQIESTKLADAKYASDYEESSLAIAKAKATQRATVINNEIQLQSARAAASTLQIQAEGRRVAAVIEAEASGETRRIEAKSRNDAAEMMEDDFAKRYALAGLQVDFARNLKAGSLTVLGGGDVGRALIAGPRAGGPRPEAMR